VDEFELLLHTSSTEWQPIDDEPGWLPSKVNNHSSLRRISLSRSTSTKLQPHSKKYELNARSNLAIIGAGNPHWIGTPLLGPMPKRCVAGIDWVQPRITESKSGKPNLPTEVQSDATNHQPPHRAPKILVVGSQRLDAGCQLCEIKWWLCWFRPSELG